MVACDFGVEVVETIDTVDPVLLDGTVVEVIEATPVDFPLI